MDKYVDRIWDWMMLTGHWLLVGLVLMVTVVLSVGFVMNAIKLVVPGDAGVFMLVTRGLGLFVTPLGAVLGWV